MSCFTLAKYLYIFYSHIYKGFFVVIYIISPYCCRCASYYRRMKTDKTTHKAKPTQSASL